MLLVFLAPLYKSYIIRAHVSKSWHICIKTMYSVSLTWGHARQSTGSVAPMQYEGKTPSCERTSTPTIRKVCLETICQLLLALLFRFRLRVRLWRSILIPMLTFALDFELYYSNSIHIFPTKHIYFALFFHNNYCIHVKTTLDPKFKNNTSYIIGTSINQRKNK